MPGEVRTVRSVGVEAPGRAYFFEYEEGPPDEGEFRVETLYTGISAGTELTFVKGTNPYLHARWDPEYGVFRRGEPSAAYPVPFLGYMEVGQVTESRAAAVPAGTIVAMAYGHKTGHTAHAAHDFFVPLPPGLDPLLGIYVAQMGPICANGVLHAAAELAGTGAGVVGLLTALFAQAHGAAEVAIADRTPARLAAARGLGLTAIDETEIEPWLWCKERWADGAMGRGVDLVFQCRGQPAYLQMALRALRPQGAVIDLAFYQGGAPEVRLGEEFHHNGLTVRCAQIGRVPRGFAPAWDRARLARATVALLEHHGAAIREHLITDVVAFDDAPALLADLAEHRRHTIQAVLQVTA